MIIPLSAALVFPLVLIILLIENRRMQFLLAFFTWGVIAGVIGALANTYVVTTLGIDFDTLKIQFAPPVEEAAKAAPLVLLYLFAPRYLRTRLIILGAILSGFGFSVAENFQYVLQAAEMHTAQLIVFMFTRSVSTMIMHGVATGIVGWTVYHVERGTLDQFGFQPIYVFMGFSFAVLVHALFNLTVQFAVLGRTVGLIGGLLSYLFLWLFFSVSSSS